MCITATVHPDMTSPRRSVLILYSGNQDVIGSTFFMQDPIPHALNTELHWSGTEIIKIQLEN